MQKILVCVLRWARRHEAYLVVGVVLCAAVLRFYAFPSVPAGLNQDEIAANYEAYSLLTTGADRWGNFLPAYFSAWGSGQNVLYSYLSVPFVAVFGMTPGSARVVALLVGVATIPLLYVAVRVWYGRQVALLAAFILAVSPWHSMLSRWGLESNLLPAFLLAGVTTFSFALKKDSKLLRLVALAPFAIALYAYGLGAIVVAVLLPLLFVMFWRQIKPHLWSWGGWSMSLVVFAVLATPFLLFIVKNYVTHAVLPFESHLPFSIPLLAESRLSQVSGSAPIVSNTQFVLAGFNDHQVWSVAPGILPLALGVLLLAVVGVGYRLFVGVRFRRQPSPFLLWLLACTPLFFMIPLNINQSNALYIPLIVFAADAAFVLARRFGKKFGALFIGALVAYLVVYCLYFMSVYTSEKYILAAKANFNPELSTVLPLANKEATAANLPLYVTNSILLNYVQTLWYLKISPTEFRSSQPTFTDTHFGRYYFTVPSLPGDEAFVFLVRSSDDYPCQAPYILQTTDDWVIGRCQV